MSNPSQETKTAPGKPKVAAKKRGAKKDSPLRQEAKAKFNASAPPMSSDKFFSDYTEIHRNNVDIKFDPTVVDRLASGYVKQADDFANYSMAPREDHDVQAITHSLISMATIRKLMLSAPQTELSDIARFKDISDHELFIPKNLAAILASIGKFEQDDFVARLKYNVQDIYRQLLSMCKIMDTHTRFHGRYFSPIPQYDDDGEFVAWMPWAEIDPNQVVLPVESSTRWLRDQAQVFLDDAYSQDWQVPVVVEGQPDPVQIRVSYPRLEISPNPETQLRNVSAWFNKLSEHHPNVNQVAAAGLCTAWQSFWTRQHDEPIRNFAPNLPEWFNLTASELLSELGVHIWSPNRALMLAGNDTISMIQDIHSSIKEFHPQFLQFLDLVKMPDDKFGTDAQMFAMDPDDFVVKPLVGLPNKTFQSPRAEASAVTIAKFKNKGNAVLGLTVGLSTAVEVKNNYRARLNGTASTILRQMVAPDFVRKY
jgi:hypothetical protein